MTIELQLNNGCFVLQCSSQFLFSFNRFKKCFKISFTETFRSFALDDLKKNCRAIFNGLSKKLQQISFFISIHKNIKRFYFCNILVNFSYASKQIIVISFGNVKKIHASLAKFSYSA